MEKKLTCKCIQDQIKLKFLMMLNDAKDVTGVLGVVDKLKGDHEVTCTCKKKKAKQ